MVVLCGYTASAPRQEIHHRSLIVFVDVSGSLDEAQASDVRKRFGRLVHGVSSLDNIEAYTITAKAGTDPVYKGPGLLGDEDLESVMKTTGKLRTATAELLHVYERQRGIDGKQSCLLNSLDFGVQRAQALRGSNGSVAMVFLSDMLEDCEQTPTGTTVSMPKTKTDFQREIRLLEKLPPRPAALKGVAFYAILPSDNHPVFVGLQEFWRLALQKYEADPIVLNEFRLWRNTFPPELASEDP
jgi:hypothetical protein